MRVEVEPIAIIGIGCRFPGAKNPEAFWRLLQNGVDIITEVPSERWDIDALYHPESATPGKMNTRWGGFLEQVDRFDPSFFRISPREAQQMDPQQRLLLEVTWEALENAGIAPESLAGSQTAAIVGISNTDYRRMVCKDLSRLEAYSGTGTNPSIAANRLSYFLNLRGPSLIIDTACSSSLVALHYACQSLQIKESNLCLVGGINLILSPEPTITLSQARMLAADGRCKTFDASADGYVRGEGCGVVVLKRLADAISDGDNIQAVIKGSAVNQDGLTNGMTAPNGPSQQAVIRQALANAGVAPAQISYVEAHGTGTLLGDPIEVKSLKSVLMEDRAGDRPCWIGSVKTNIGHLEAAAGIAGLIKVVLSLQHQEIPPHLHLKQLNPYLKIKNTPIQIPTELQPWQVGSAQRLAGLSSFGFGGTNAHVILEEAPDREVDTKESGARSHQILTLSAKCDRALKELVQRYQDCLNENSTATLADICFTANTGRSHFNHRLAIVASDNQDLANKLAEISEGAEALDVFARQLPSNYKSPKIAFLFTGQGSQYLNMGCQLYETQPTFRQAIDECAELMKPDLEQPLLSILYPEECACYPIDQTIYAQPTLFALEYALCRLWQSWGVNPDAVLGHSVGEYVAAVVAGVMNLADGVKLVTTRARLMQSLPSTGEMVAVFATPDEIQKVVTIDDRSLSFAAYNSPQNTVISGEDSAIAAACDALTNAGIGFKQLRTSHAFHSVLMEPILAQFRQVTAAISYHPPQIPLISNLTGQQIGANEIDAEYWCQHLRQTVKFANSLNSLDELGLDIFLEIGPKPTLIGIGQQCLAASDRVWLSSLRPKREDWEEMLTSLARLAVNGAEIDWVGFDRDFDRRKLVLPTYPFQRERYWIETNIKHIEESKTVVILEGLRVEKAISQPLLETKLESINNWSYKVEWITKARSDRLLATDEFLTPVEIEQQLTPSLTELLKLVDNNYSKKVQHSLEELSIDYIVQALLSMGWAYSPAERFTTEEATQSLDIVPSQLRLFNRILQILVEVGIIQPNQQYWHVLLSLEQVNPTEKSQVLITQYVDEVAALKLLDRCGSNLSRVLQGKIDPIQLVFPEGDFTPVTQLYQDSPIAKVMNTILQKAVTAAVEKIPKNRRIRLLEIGAGTGGTTSYILPHLDRNQVEYTFTDIGLLFTTRAQEKFRDYPFVQYQVLDIEADPVIQGFDSHHYNVVIAANVLHATTSLKEALLHVRQLLAPGGILVLYETTTSSKWIDLIFGLLEGWWKFQDIDLRPDYPLLSRTRWKQLLIETGFTQVVTLPEIDEMAEILLNQAVIVATADRSTIKQSSSAHQEWLLFADENGVAQHLATQLRSRGDFCTLIFAGDRYQQISPAEFMVNPRSPEEFEQLIATVANRLPSLYGVVHCWSSKVLLSDFISSEKLESLFQLGCGTTLYLVKALAQRGLAPRLWLATQGAQPIPCSNNLDILEVAQSFLWGMDKVIALEHPEFKCVRIDLDPSALVEEQAQALWEEICSEDSEDRVAIRGRDRYVARLSRHHYSQGRDREYSTQRTQKSKHYHVLDKLKAASTGDKERLLIAYLQDEISQVLRINNYQIIDIHQPLNTMGLDSLMSMQLRNQLQSELLIDLPMVKFMENISIVDLSIEISRQLKNNEIVQIDYADDNRLNLLNNVKDSEQIEGEI
jgi:microcystin synthetase protein McyG